MNKASKKNNQEFIDVVNLKMITFITIIFVVIITLAYFIRIYSNHKESIKNEMQSEINVLKSIVTDHLYYSNHVINVMGRMLNHRYDDYKHINHIFQNHCVSQKFNPIFGWRKCSWTNYQFNEIITSNRGIVSKPKYLNYVEKIVVEQFESDHAKQHLGENPSYFYVSKSPYKGDRLKIINNMIDSKTNTYYGSIILSYDLQTLTQQLESRKNKKYTNFLILSNQLKIISKSKGDNSHIVDESNNIDPEILSLIKNEKKANKIVDSDYLNTISGVNYRLKSLAPEFPFYLLVNIDNNVIRQQMIELLTKKFLEVSIYAILILLLVVTIYRRETFLFSKAEKATKSAIDAAKTRTDFLTYTAHEVRSPLGFIQTGSEAMMQELFGPLPKKYKDYAEGINRHSHQILDFINDILDENQIMEGKFKIINSISDVQEIMQEAINLNFARFNTRKAKIALNVVENLPALICDRRRILQVFTNLISNSIKYSDNINIIITVKMDGHNMRVIIQDHGVGMTVDEIQMAMSRYGRVHKNNYAVGSYGLGLPIVQMLLLSHGADFNISSQVNKGTIVSITFPKYKVIYKKRG